MPKVRSLRKKRFLSSFAHTRLGIFFSKLLRSKPLSDEERSKRIISWYHRSLRKPRKWSLTNRFGLQPIPNYIYVPALTIILGVGGYFAVLWIKGVFAAGEDNYIWDFSVPGDYIVSDATSIEVTNNTARLKVQNYSSDSNTQMLFHFDENAGSIANDSSPNNNDGTISSGTWSSGILNYSMGFNISPTSPNTTVVVTDTDSLTPSSEITIEAWTKFLSGFSAASHISDQVIVDKGSYQFFYDYQTGKLVFDLEDPNQDTWTRKAGGISSASGSEVMESGTSTGSWDYNGKPSAKTMVVMGGNIYVGLGNNIHTNNLTGPSDAEVWKYTVSTGLWSQIGGDGTGWANEQYDDVYSMVTDGTSLFVGLGATAGEAEVWRYTSGTWSKVGGDGSGSGGGAESWGNSNTYEAVTSLAISGNYLLVGLGLSANDAEVWRCNNKDTCTYNSGWYKIGGDSTGTGDDSWAANYEMVSAMKTSGNALIVGLGSSAGDAEVWRCADLTSCTTTSGWNKLGGDSTGSGDDSWTNAYDIVNALYLTTGSPVQLYVGLGVTADEGQVWNCSDISTCSATAGWTRMGDSGDFGTGIEEVWDLVSDGTYLYAGLGNGQSATASSNDAEVWRCTLGSCGTWTRLAGDGAVTSPTYHTNIPMNTHSNVSALAVDSGVLYIGLQNQARNNIAEVWSCTAASCSSSLERIAGNYIRKSWGMYSLHSVESFTKAGGKLYAGTGYTTNNTNGIDGIYGNALVWEYDVDATPPWSIIGGQGINSGWGIIPTNSAPYESVTTMAEYNGKLHVGLGNTEAQRDAEVWVWEKTSNDTWEKVGGDTVNSSWDSGSETHGSVMSMAVHYCSGSTTNRCLFAGLGGGANDAEVWQYNGSSWTIIGGDTSGSWSSAGSFTNVYYMTVHDGYLYAGIGGGSTGMAEVWKWSGNGTTWTMFGGNNGSTNVNSSWDPAGTVEHTSVESLATYDGELYAGLGSATGNAEVWKFNGSTWSLVGGDGTGWIDATYENVPFLVTYNGRLYAGLGFNAAGDGEVWVYNGSTWSRSAGDGTGWADSTIEQIKSLAVYNGTLFAGTGNTQDADANVWSLGADKIVRSNTVGQDTNWHHIAATYDGDVMKIYIDGAEDISSDISDILMPNSTTDLYIGSYVGQRREAGLGGLFQGYLDELRISNIARTSFNSSPYSTSRQTVRPSAGQLKVGTGRYEDFIVTDAGLGTLTYQLSNDEGASWYWYDSGDSQWEVAADLTMANTEADVDTNINTFPQETNPTTGASYGVMWRAILYDSSGDDQVTVNSVRINVTPDYPPGLTGGNPNPADTFTALDAPAGSPIFSGTWANSATPYFEWSGADDDTDSDTNVDPNESGIAGYWVYFGTDDTAEPSTSGTFQLSTDENYSPSSMTSGETYYLRIRAQDVAGNLSSIFPVVSGNNYFEYLFDNEAPTNPLTSAVTITPSTAYNATDTYTFAWPNSGSSAAKDCDVGETCSGIDVFQFKTGTTDPGSIYYDWQDLASNIFSYTSPASAIAYKEEDNDFYFRVKDFAGNISSYLTKIFYYSGNRPGPVRDLTASPVTSVGSPSTSNAFTFTWTVPENMISSADEVDYLYTINVEPPASSGELTECLANGQCHILEAPGSNPQYVSLGPDAYATNQAPLKNTFYVVTRNTLEQFSSGSVQSVDFYVDTPAPGIPTNIDIADVSVKSTSSWKLALSWEAPTVGDVSTYEIFRSTDDITYTRVNTTEGGTAYFDVGLTQQTYYYKVKACDNANSCGALTDAVSMYPTGKYTEAAGLSAEPTVTDITTKKATISWSTDRASDSKIAYGEDSDDYFDSEPSNSSQVTDHEIELTELSPGTTYYFVAKWTDEDGNTGLSEEITFETEPAPVVTDPKAKFIGIDNVSIEYTVEGASKVRIYYGETSAFGGTMELSTSTEEATYLTNITSLKDGTKYFYKVNTFDTEDDEYEGNILSFETLPRPKISNVRIQQVRGTAQPTMLVTWSTNTEVSSIVTFYPQGLPAEAKDVVNVALETGAHRSLISGLKPETAYTLVVSGRDKSGNEARSDPQTFTTATDTRAPMITGLKVEGTIISTGSGQDKQKQAQLIVSWDTDEPGTSQIEFGEGSGTTYAQRTQEDTNLTYNHVVVMSNLAPSRVYHLRAISKDTAGNEALSVDTVTITPKATDSALDLVIANLSEVFGFLGNLGQ